MTHILENMRELARRAHYATSHVPDERAEQMVGEYSAELESDLVIVRENDGDEQRYMENYRKHLSAWLTARSRCMSTLVTGSANFNTRRAEKANASERKRSDEFRQWRERALKAIARNGRRMERAATSEVEEMTKKIAGAEAAHEHMKRANTILRKHRKNPEAAIPVLVAELGMSEKQAGNRVAPDVLGDVGYARYMLTNNNANIRRMKERLAELERKEAASGQETKSLAFSGGEVELDFQDDRIRILYPGKPDAATIANLKRHGFRWKPTVKGWQRQLTIAAIHAVTAVTDTDAKDLLAIYRESGR